MNFFKALVSLPEFAIALEEFASWVIDQIRIARNKKLLEDMSKAIVKAQDKKDTSEIEDLFSKKKK